jgi:hypothetical protein
MWQIALQLGCCAKMILLCYVIMSSFINPSLSPPKKNLHKWSYAQFVQASLNKFSISDSYLFHGALSITGEDSVTSK